MSQPNPFVLNEMKKLLAVAADVTRLKILFSIADEEKCVSDIVSEVQSSQSLVSHQLRVLKDANLLTSRKEGTRVFYRIADDHVYQLLSAVVDHAKEKEREEFHA